MYTVAPKPVFKPLVEKKEAPINENYAEIRVSKEKGEKVDVGTLAYFSNFTYQSFPYKLLNYLYFL